MKAEDYIYKYIQEDNISENDEGFHWRGRGRGGHIYFVEKQSIVPIAIEMPAVDHLDVLVFGETEHIKYRYFINNNRIEEIPVEDRFRIQNLLVQWLNNKGLRHDIRIGE